MRILIDDLRHAARRLLRTPSFTTLAVLTVGLGVGATTVMFSAVHGVLLKPLPYSEPDRLVMIRGATRTQPGRPGVISFPDYRDWRRESRSFETMAALRAAEVTLSGAGGPERIEGARVTASFFQTLRVVPELGHLFPEELDRRGGERVAVLGHRLWRHLGADPALVGRSLTLERTSLTPSSASCPQASVRRARSNVPRSSPPWPWTANRSSNAATGPWSRSAVSAPA